MDSTANRAILPGIQQLVVHLGTRCGGLALETIGLDLPVGQTLLGDGYCHCTLINRIPA